MNSQDVIQPELDANSPIIYGYPHNCFTIAVMQCLIALNMKPKLREVLYGNREQIITLTSGNSYYVPVLQYLQDIVWENIAFYIDEKMGNNRLLPSDKAGLQTIVVQFLTQQCHELVEMLTIGSLLDDMDDLVEKVMVIRHKERKYGEHCVERWRESNAELYQQFQDLILPFEQMLSYTPFLLGEEPVYADFLFYGVMVNLTYNNYFPFPDSYRNIQKWCTAISDFRYE